MTRKALVLQSGLPTVAADMHNYLDVAVIKVQQELEVSAVIKQLESDKFDYVICCDDCPESVLEQLNELKNSTKVPFDTRVLAFSYNLNHEHKHQALALGIIDFHDLNHVDSYDVFFKPTHTKSQPSHILLVDENKEHAEYLSQVLKNEGHTITHHVDMHQAHEHHLKQNYDLAVVDVLHISRYLDKYKLIEDINTVVISEYIKTDILVDLLQFGVSEVINKPIVEEEFLIRIDRVLKNKHYRDALDQRSRHLLELSIKDALTGAFNRRFMEEMIEQRMGVLRRNNEPFAILMLDIDDFKVVNDTMGHQAGDRVLIKVVEWVRSHIRNIDCCCRYGGEEFIVLLADCSLKQAVIKAEEIRQRIESGGPTVSIGVAVFDDPNSNMLIEEHVNMADLALYQAKKQGKNRVAIYPIE